MWRRDKLYHSDRERDYARLTHLHRTGTRKVSRQLFRSLFLYLTLAGPALANSPTVELHLPTRSITTAQRLELTLSVTAPFTDHVTLPGLNQDFGEFTLVDHQATERTLAGKSMFGYRSTYLLEPFLPGEYTLPRLTVYRQQEHGLATPLYTEPQTIMVHSVLGDQPEKAKLLDIIETLPQTSPVNWPLCIAAYIILANLCLLFAIKKGTHQGPALTVTTRERTMLAAAESAKQHPPAYPEIASLLATTRDLPHCAELWQTFDHYRYGKAEVSATDLGQLVDAICAHLPVEEHPA